MENKTVPEPVKESTGAKLGKSFGSMFKRLFIREKDHLSVLEEEALQTPTQTVFKNFVRTRLGVVGVIAFILIMLFSFVGSQLRPIDESYQEPALSNIRPGANYLKYPAQIVKEGVKEISSGISYSVALTNEGNVYAWGKQPIYLSGMSTSVFNFPAGFKQGQIAHIAAGDRFWVALSEDGEFYGLGYNNFKQAELPEEAKEKMQSSSVKQLLAGEGVTGILFEDGEIFIWGSTMSTRQDNVPKEYQGRIVHAEFTSLNVVVLLDDGTIGVFGVSGNELSLIPAELTDGSVEVVAFTTSGRAALALDSTGKLHVWGSRLHDILQIPDFEGKVVDLFGGKNNFGVLLDNGQVIYWGANHFNQLAFPKAMKSANYVSVYSDMFQSYAVAEDGNVTAWGHKGFVFGSDQFGRDNLTRLIHGGRISLTVGAIAMIISVIIALFIGLVSGYFGGWLDNLLMRITDVVISIPFMPLAITLSTIVTGRVPEMYRIYMIMVILGFLNWPGLARLIRAHLLLEREKDFVLAARALGVKQRNIMVRHILPNIFNLVIVNVTLGYAGALLMESALSFLGFGVSPPTPSWGNMLDSAQSSTVIQYYWWRWVIPGLAVIFAALSVNLIGDALRDAMDPKASEK
ncbi:MAG TPA: peptide ABC transporter permease [Firmicutes bacterium]|jgi:peptide/nickel transport system permease protein|nr:peptide ABC transporter permease [Bacillota bacterium]